MAASDQTMSLEELLRDPPRGCSYVDDGVTMRVRASTRSLGGAVAMLLVSMFWNSIVSVFVGITALSLWARLVGPIPGWLPFSSSGSGPLPLGVALFMVVFLIPFVAVGSLLGSLFFMALLGHIEVRVREREGTVFTGVGWIGKTRRFDAVAVRGVRLVETKGEESSRTEVEIDTGGLKTLKLGASLPRVRRAWTAGVLRAVLAPGGQGG